MALARLLPLPRLQLRHRHHGACGGPPGLGLRAPQLDLHRLVRGGASSSVVKHGSNCGKQTCLVLSCYFGRRRYAMLDSLQAGDGVCDIGVAGIEISQDLLAAGVAFSFPTLRGGYKVMVLPQDNHTNYWYFLDAFAWQVRLDGVGRRRWAAGGAAQGVPAPPPGARHTCVSLQRGLQGSCRSLRTVPMPGWRPALPRDRQAGAGMRGGCAAAHRRPRPHTLPALPHPQAAVGRHCVHLHCSGRDCLGRGALGLDQEAERAARDEDAGGASVVGAGAAHAGARAGGRPLQLPLQLHCPRSGAPLAAPTSHQSLVFSPARACPCSDDRHDSIHVFCKPDHHGFWLHVHDPGAPRGCVSLHPTAVPLPAAAPLLLRPCKLGPRRSCALTCCLVRWLPLHRLRCTHPQPVSEGRPGRHGSTAAAHVV